MPDSYCDLCQYTGPLSESGRCPKCGGANVRKAEIRLKTISAGDLLKKEFGTRRWKLKGLIPEVGTIFVAGKRGANKSWFALSVGCAIAEGKPFLGHFETIQSPVVYIDAENGEFVMQERLKMLGENPANFHFLFFPSLRFDEGGLLLLEELLTDKPRALIIVDCFSRFVGFDENAAPEMSRILSQIRTYSEKNNWTFLFLHHVRKGMPGMKNSDQLDELRGSSELTNLADGVLVLERSRADPTSVILHHSKSRVGVQQEPMRLTFEVKDGKATFTYLGTWKELETQPELVGKAILKWTFESAVKKFKTGDVLQALKPSGFNSKAIGRGLKWAVEQHLLQKPEKGLYEVPSGTLEDYDSIGQNGQGGLSHDENPA